MELPEEPQLGGDGIDSHENFHSTSQAVAHRTQERPKVCDFFSPTHNLLWHALIV